MRILSDLSVDELKTLVDKYGEKPYRAGQIFRAVSNGQKISEMTELSKTFREKLLETFVDEPVEIIKRLVSKDGTEKYLFKLSDGNIVEGVYMKNDYGNTECLSTQVGCRMGCAFCASGIGGLVRNLTAGEMLSTVAAVNRLNGGNILKRKVTNLVLMGSGEPLDNYDETVKFLRLLSDKNGLNVSLRNVSLSTCGLSDKIIKFADENLPVNMTVSLHAATDEKRKTIMPVAKAYKISDILAALDYYFNKTGRRYIFEYSLISGVNDDFSSADDLIKILRHRPCHVNLIRLNEVKEKNLKGISDKRAYAFCEYLTKNGLSATVRRLNGADIDGACGQLRRDYIKSDD